MSSGKGRAKLSHAYTRFLQRRTWAAMVRLLPDLSGIEVPDFNTVSTRKGWVFIDEIEKKYGMDRDEIERNTRAL